MYMCLGTHVTLWPIDFSEDHCVTWGKFCRLMCFDI